MAHRRRNIIKRDVFGETDDYGTEVDPQAVADSIYGSRNNEIIPGLVEVDAKRRVAFGVDIMKIFPDPTQPRRIIPHEIRGDWDGHPAGVAALLDRWLEAITIERNGVEFDLDAHLLASQDTERITTYLLSEEDAAAQNSPDGDGREPGPLEAAFLPIVDLAASIRRDGLTNPITVVETELTYRLETGERRWLAYHLLYNWAQRTRHDKPEAYTHILATNVPKIDVWRQASENNARAELNAIGKARQFALLLMDLLQEEKGEEFQPYYALVKPRDCDRAYYAQVADGTKYRIPRNKGEKLLNAMGLKNGKQLKQHRALLHLPDEIWQIADDLNWTEGKLREIAAYAADGDFVKARQLACEELKKENYKGPIDPLCEEVSSPKDKAKAAANRENKAYQQIVAQLERVPLMPVTVVEKLSLEQKQHLLVKLQQLEEWIEKMRGAL